MKRTLFPITAVLAALTLFFASCQDPVTTDYPGEVTQPGAVPAPSGVQAFAYEGLNIVTWQPVSNVVGYRVYRRDVSASGESLGDKPVEVQWSTVSGATGYDPALNIALDLYFVDPVTFSNQLVNEHDYVYYVEAVSGLSTASGRAVGSYTPTTENQGDSLGDVYLQNSPLAESNRVKAKVPARDGNYEWIAVGDLAVEADATTGNQIVVTWTAKPNLDYAIKYTWGKGAGLGIDRDGLPDASAGSVTLAYAYSPFNSVGYTVFPAAGGTNSVTVTAKFAGGDQYFNKTADAVIDAVYPGGLGSPVLTVGSSRENNGWVKLSWLKVEDATGYKVYRAERVLAVVETIKGDWTEVTGPVDLRQDSNGYILYDTTAAKDKGYRYMLIAEQVGAETLRSLPSSGTIDAESILNSRPNPAANFGAAWVNLTDVKVQWDLDTTADGISYKLYRGSATFKNEATDTISNLTAYDYSTETAITVGADNYINNSTVVVVDKPVAPPTDKAWVYRVVAEQHGLSSESEFAAITLLTAPGAPIINVGAYAADTTKAFITWDIPNVDLYDATFTLTKAEILSYNPGTTIGLAGVNQIASLGPYVGAKTTDGVIDPADYREGRAVVVDGSSLTTRKQYLYRLVVTKGNLVSDPSYAILQTPAFVPVTSVTLSDANTLLPLAPGGSDPNNYQAANTLRVTLNNLSGTYWGDSPKIELYRRESTDPETAFERVDTDLAPAFTVTDPAPAFLVWSDSTVDYNKSYYYKVVVRNTNGSIRFESSPGTGTSGVLTPAWSLIFASGKYSGTLTSPANTIRLRVNGNAYKQGMKVKYRTKATGSEPFTGTWRNATVVKGIESSTPNIYSYYFDVTGVTAGNGYDIQYYTDQKDQPVPDDTTVHQTLTAN